VLHSTVASCQCFLSVIYGSISTWL